MQIKNKKTKKETKKAKKKMIEEDAVYKCLKCGDIYNDIPGPTQCLECGSIWCEWVNWDEWSKKHYG